MENRRIIGDVSHVLLALAVLILCFPAETIAWDNQTVHPQINSCAIELFQTLKNNDPGLKNVTFGDVACWGESWVPESKTDLFHQPSAAKNQHTIRDWIIWGGFSADEPEGPMALRHFYNPYPEDNPKPWLTDQQQIVNFLRKHVSSTIRNPEISLIEWAEDLEKGRVDDYFLPQNYSWYDAKLYFSKALADGEAYNVNYGKAWRAVGETMHLVADLTLPPHVRNDGHASFFGGSLGDAEPVETSTTGEHVIRYYQTTGGWSTAINYNQDVIGMMRQIARWTNSNFLSKDTIPLAGNPNTSNGFPAFPSPAVAGRTPDENGYIWYQVDGRDLRLARTSSLYRWGLSGNPAYFLDNVVIADQRSILLPTAVRAAEAVLERFLPRFKVEAQVKPDPRIPGRYQVHGRLVQGQDNVTGYEWQKYGRLIVRNGARIIVNGKQVIPVKVVTREEELNEFTRDISVDAGTTVSAVVSYDLGGYVVQSEPVTAAPAPAKDEGYWCTVCLEDSTGINKYYFAVTFSRDGKQYGPGVSVTDLYSFGCAGDKIKMERGKYTANIKYGPPGQKQNEIKMEVSIPENLDKKDNLKLVVPKFGFK